MKLIRGSFLYYHSNPQYILLGREMGFFGKPVKGIWNEFYNAEQAAKSGDTIIEVKTIRTWDVNCPKATLRT